jgi:hypothetical protein
VFAQLDSLYLFWGWDDDRLPPPDVPRDRSSDDHPFRDDGQKKRHAMMGIITGKRVNTLHRRR